MKKKLLSSFGITLALLLGLLGTTVVAAQPGSDLPVRWIVTFDEAVNQAAEQYVTEKGGQVLGTFEIVPGMVVLLPGQSVQGLRGLAGIREVGLDGRIHATDAELDNSWGVGHIGAGIVHSYNQGAGIKVGIIDSGVDYNHPDLDANYAGGYDFVNNDSDPLDDNGHGTHVAGTIAAEDNNDGVVGVAPAASIYALKALDADGSGYWSDLISALEWAVNNGIQVVNMSLGASRDAPGVHDAVRVAYDAGVVLVAAAGNSGNPGGKSNSIEYPGRYDEVIAVAATDQGNTRAGFSSTGDQLELAAPGVNVNSTLLGGGYGKASGTSMASPHVAGTAALVLASGTLADLNGDGTVNNQDLRLLLQQTADDLGDSGKDAQYGYGLVDADEAAPVPTTTGSISGTVTSGVDGTAISGATVEVDTGQSATTAGDGTYSIAGVPTGDRSVTASADGFEEQTKTATVTDGGTTTIDFVLDSVTTATGVSVTGVGYTATGGKDQNKHLDIMVTLEDNLGNPVAGASVSINLDNTTTGESWIGTATTGADGAVIFNLKNAPSGTYTTTVTDVVATGLTWDGITPSNTFTK